MASLRGRPWGAGGPIHTDARQGREAGRPGGSGQSRGAELWGQGGSRGRTKRPELLLPHGFTGECWFFF